MKQLFSDITNVYLKERVSSAGTLVEVNRQ